MKKVHMITILTILLVLVSGYLQLSYNNHKKEYYMTYKSSYPTSIHIIFTKDNNNYTLKEYLFPIDSREYIPSIQESAL